MDFKIKDIVKHNTPHFSLNTAVLGPIMMALHGFPITGVPDTRFAWRGIGHTIPRLLNAARMRGTFHSRFNPVQPVTGLDQPCLS